MCQSQVCKGHQQLLPQVLRDRQGVFGCLAITPHWSIGVWYKPPKRVNMNKQIKYVWRLMLSPGFCSPAFQVWNQEQSVAQARKTWGGLGSDDHFCVCPNSSTNSQVHKRWKENNSKNQPNGVKWNTAALDGLKNLKEAYGLWWRLYRSK